MRPYYETPVIMTQALATAGAALSGSIDKEGSPLIACNDALRIAAQSSRDLINT